MMIELVMIFSGQEIQGGSGRGRTNQLEELKMQQKVGWLATFYFSHVEGKVRLRCVQGAALN